MDFSNVIDFSILLLNGIILYFLSLKMKRKFFKIEEDTLYSDFETSLDLEEAEVPKYNSIKLHMAFWFLPVKAKESVENKEYNKLAQGINLCVLGMVIAFFYLLFLAI